MALPTILVDSATGSDTAASGAGPGTALTGSAASTDATGLIVTLDGSPDLSGVATDGSHVIFLNDSTAGKRNFGKITAADNGAKTVTVADAFDLSISGKAWAIGGKRASIGGTTSKKMFDNNAAAGDAMPGWIVQMQSGHSETIAATYDMRRSGDTTSGTITLEGVNGAATLPLITFSNNGGGITSRGTGLVLQRFELRNSNATKTASVAISSGSSSEIIADKIKISHSTNKFWKGIVNTQNGWVIKNCEIGFTASYGLDISSATVMIIANNYIHDCGNHGIYSSSTNTGFLLVGNIIARNSGDGFNFGYAGGSINSTMVVIGNTFDANTGDGLEFTSNDIRTFDLSHIANNIFSNNGGYGLNYSAGGVTSAAIAYYKTSIAGNTFYNNTSGTHNPATIATSYNENTGNPNYSNAASGDFSIGAGLKAVGTPIGGTEYVGGYSSTYSYVDPGASQRQEGIVAGTISRPVAAGWT